MWLEKAKVAKSKALWSFSMIVFFCCLLLFNLKNTLSCGYQNGKENSKCGVTGTLMRC